jgi:hypothetical protein
MNTEWKPLSSEVIGNNVVEMIKYRESDGLLVVATHGNGVYSTHIKHSWDLTGLKENSNIKEPYNIYPNPSYGKIALYLSKKAYEIKDIKIYSASGKKIEFSLNKEDLKINIYPEIKTSGLFYLVISSESRIVTKKFLFFNSN